MASSSDPMKDNNYDEAYFKSHCGLPYERSAIWLKFFGNVATQIVHQFSPQTALDAGCAIGMLVEALRNYGVAAEGFDISEYAVSQVPDHLKPYVSIDNVLNPNAVTKHYDVIICIEVLEHLSEAEADVAIANLSRWGNTVVFSSTPDDFSEPTHVNVQKPGYWIERFAQHGLIYAPELDASYISAWTMIFQRRTPVLPQILRDYGNHMWNQRREILNSRSLLEQVRQENTLLIEHQETIKNSSIAGEGETQAILGTALRQEKEKRIKLAEAYTAQIEELRAQTTLAMGLHDDQIVPTKENSLRFLPSHRLFSIQRSRERVFMLLRTSLSILRTEGVIPFANRLYRWLRGERRYFPSRAQNSVKKALARQKFPESRQRPMLSNFTILFIVPVPEISSKRYRVFNIQEQLQKKNIKTNWIDEREFRLMPQRALQFNIVVFARVAYAPDMAPFLEEARNLSIPIVFEIDDLVFDTSMLQYINTASTLAGHELETYVAGMSGYSQMLRCCDFFIGSTEHISNSARSSGKADICHP